MKHFSNQRGSTLIEILVSMIIMTITLLGGIALYFNASEIQKMAIHKKMATELASTKMEKYRDKTCESIDISLGTDNDVWKDYSIGGLNLMGSDGKGIKVRFTDQTDYCWVEVSIKWNEVGQINRDFVINLATYVAP